MLYLLRQELRPRYKENLEESLVEISQMTASMIAVQGTDEHIDVKYLDRVFGDLYSRTFDAQIYSIEKKQVEVQAYVTDAQGRVVYDTLRQDVGKDFSRWNDVFRTLRGDYGARSTRVDPDNDLSSILYVAAPIIRNGSIIGVVSVSRPELALEDFLARSQNQMLLGGVVTGVGIILLILLLSFAVTRPIAQLIDYANRNRGEGRAPLPRLGVPEFRKLGEAFEEMRIALEGKKAIESSMQSLTRELKNPLTAIRGSAGLAQEADLNPVDRGHLLKNIETESTRMHELIERLLAIVSLESRTGIENEEKLDLVQISKDVMSSLESLAAQKNVRIDMESGHPSLLVKGERLLVEQALRNLVQNAIDFSPAGAAIQIEITSNKTWATLRVIDEGLGIPDFAQARIFEKFYSLERPSTGKKGAGLGLSFVREAVALHGGEVDITNRNDRSGALAVLKLPMERA